MMRKEITVFDAVQTVIIMEHCLHSGLLAKLPTVIMSPDTYEEAKYQILLRLNLDPSSFVTKEDIRQQKRKKRRMRGAFFDEFHFESMMSVGSDKSDGFSS